MDALKICSSACGESVVGVGCHCAQNENECYTAVALLNDLPNLQGRLANSSIDGICSEGAGRLWRAAASASSGFQPYLQNCVATRRSRLRSLLEGEYFRNVTRLDARWEHTQAELLGATDISAYAESDSKHISGSVGASCSLGPGNARFEPE